MKLLNKEKVRTIRELHSTGLSIQEIADIFNFSHSGIRGILTNRSWYDKDFTPYKRIPVDLDLCHNLYNSGMSFEEIRYIEAEKWKRIKPLCCDTLRKALVSAGRL